MHVVIFEDSLWHAFAPFSLSRPTFTLATGMTNLLAKQIRRLNPSRLTLWVRPEMQAFCKQRVAPETGVATQVNVPLDAEPALLVNGRTVPSENDDLPGRMGVAIDGDTILAAATTSHGLAPLDAIENSQRWERLRALPAMPWRAQHFHSPVDLIYWNEESLADDFARMPQISSPKPSGAYHLVNEMDIHLGRDVVFAPGCVIDASKGTVVLAAGASVGHNAVVQGPCYIGPQASVSTLSNIRSGTTVGPMCRVGGEVSLTIFLGYSNKVHDGFLGHSYIGKWANLGAGTTTSNLKNTYGEITLKRGNTEISTGRRFLGALIGDHSKTAILTRMMGGTYVGFCCMLAGSGVMPRFMPSFSFWTDKGREPYDRNKAIEVAQRVFTRRSRTWTETDDDIFSYVAAEAPKVEM